MKKTTLNRPGKHIPRLYQPDLAAAGAMARLADPAQYHHLVHVLRMGVGDDINLFNEEQGEIAAHITATDKKSVTVSLGDLITPPPPPKLTEITLYFALIKRDALGFLLEKATELGVDALQPMTSDYSQNEAYHGDRAAAITRAATEQSRRLSLPRLAAPRRLDEIFAAPSPAAASRPDSATRPAKIFFCAVEQPALPLLLPTAISALGEIIGQNQGVNTHAPLPLGLVIGPEGGFSPREVALLSQHTSARLVSLGSEILRSETAALAGLAVIQAVLRQSVRP
ncbi:MAG: RsmE family RNA methyltransferase [Candidatus Symbiobacter sp.]|nr:RsmE family RNA methyltransferase [Candidatus Symbiobacter sp.]